MVANVDDILGLVDSWSPFVGLFIARISKGRSIREFVCGVLGVPVVISIIWFTVFGVTGIETGRNNYI